jgi:hypothetical protein
MSNTNGTIQDIATFAPGATSCTCGKGIPAPILEQAARDARILSCGTCHARFRVSGAVRAPEPSIPEPIRDQNKRAERAVREGGTDLGAVTWYDFPGVELPADDLEHLALASGIAEEHVAGIRAHGALGRACRAVQVQGVQSLRASATDTSLEFAFTSRAGDAGSLTRQDVQRVTYDRASKSLTFATTWREQEIRDAFSRYTVNVTSEKVSETVRRVLDAAGAVRLRALGVVYFVPAHALATLEQVKTFASKLRALGHKANVGDARLADSPESRETVRVGAEEHITSDLEHLATSLSDAIEASKQGTRKVRASTFLGFRRDAELLAEKGTCYAELAELNAGEIRAKVDAIRERVAQVAEVAELDSDIHKQSGETWSGVRS